MLLQIWHANLRGSVHVEYFNKIFLLNQEQSEHGIILINFGK